MRQRAARWARRHRTLVACAAVFVFSVSSSQRSSIPNSLQNRSLICELVSRGFVVASFQYPGELVARPMLYYSSEADFRHSVDLDDARARAYARDASAALDRLAVLNKGESDGRFAHRLSLERTGILGYSFGGAVAAQATVPFITHGRMPPHFFVRRAGAVIGKCRADADLDEAKCRNYLRPCLLGGVGGRGCLDPARGRFALWFRPVGCLRQGVRLGHRVIPERSG